MYADVVSAAMAATVSAVGDIMLAATTIDARVLFIDVVLRLPCR